MSYTWHSYQLTDGRGVISPGGGGVGVLDISLGGEVQPGPSYPDPV